MTIYQCLLNIDELGYLKPLMNKGVISSHYVQWMEIYAYHLQHPSMSYFELSLTLNLSKSTIQRALSTMNQPLT